MLIPSPQQANPGEFTQSGSTHSHTVGRLWSDTRYSVCTSGSDRPNPVCSGCRQRMRPALVLINGAPLPPKKTPDLKCTSKATRDSRGDPGPSHTHFCCCPCSNKVLCPVLPPCGAAGQGPRAAGPARALETGDITSDSVMVRES